MDDLEERVFGELPDETWVYPGHGDDTLGAERPSLPEWRARLVTRPPSGLSRGSSCSRADG
jgi:glyoxylase-like metal-dependent hydrolase (beta-lactamase superfamily II)